MPVAPNEIPLKAKTAREARAEIDRRWPHCDVSYYGYIDHEDGDECVLMSLVRHVTKAILCSNAQDNWLVYICANPWWQG